MPKKTKKALEVWPGRRLCAPLVRIMGIALEQAVKRVADLVAALCLITLLSPIMALVGLIIRVSSPGPVLFRHRRMGKNGEPFYMFKFRTMVDGADCMGPEVTIESDSRITKVGKFLRKAKLDELPQLFNVVRGDMSLVGPRPQSLSYIPFYPKDDLDVILSVRPGITGPTQLWLRDEERLLAKQDNPLDFYTNDLLPLKIASDVAYVYGRTLPYDLGVLIKTATALFVHRPVDIRVPVPASSAQQAETKTQPASRAA